MCWKHKRKPGRLVVWSLLLIKLLCCKAEFPSIFSDVSLFGGSDICVKSVSNCLWQFLKNSAEMKDVPQKKNKCCIFGIHTQYFLHSK